MKIRTFWMLLLKIMGLFFIYAAVAYVPNTFFVIFNTYGFEIREARGFLVVFALILLGIYYFLIKYFLFKPQDIIDAFKLDQNFTEDEISANIQTNTVIRIAVIVLGGVLFLQTLPELFQMIIQTFQSKAVFREDPNIGMLVYTLVKVVLGYWMMSNSAQVMRMLHSFENTSKN